MGVNKYSISSIEFVTVEMLQNQSENYARIHVPLRMSISSINHTLTISTFCTVFPIPIFPVANLVIIHFKNTWCVLDASLVSTTEMADETEKF
jgi:hypothetical protein